jgi:hypothetical protein
LLRQDSAQLWFWHGVIDWTDYIRPMSPAKLIMVLAASTLMSAAAWAVIPERYQTIPDRNAFGLNPPAVVDPGAAVTNTPPVDVKLTGFAIIAGEKRAYFFVPAKDPKAQQRYFNMGEGERDGSLEVVSISQAEGEVRVRNSGVDMVLSLKNNGIKGASVNPNVPIAPHNPPPMPGAPGAAPSAVYNPAAASSVVVNPNAGQEVPQPQPIGNAPSQPPGAQPGQDGLRSIPTRTLRVQPQPPPLPEPVQQP